jgi:hypothetical protein
MLVQLPASSQELEQIKRELIFIGLILIPVLTVEFAYRFVLWLMPSFLRSERSYKLLADLHRAQLLRRGSENPLKMLLSLDGGHP